MNGINRKVGILEEALACWFPPGPQEGGLPDQEGHVGGMERGRECRAYAFVGGESSCFLGILKCESQWSSLIKTSHPGYLRTVSLLLYLSK